MAACVDEIAEVGELDVSGELPLVQVEGLLEDLVFQDVADVLLVWAGGFPEVGEVGPDKGAHLVDLL